MKAQFWSFDAMFAMLIFLFAIVMLSFVWYNISNQLPLAAGYGPNGMLLQLNLLQAELLSSGSPSGWASSVNITDPNTWSNISIGIGTGSGTGVSYSKLMELDAMSNYDYNATKGALGIGFDYYITVRSDTIPMDIRIGRDPANSGTTSVQVAHEGVVIDGEPAEATITLWTNSTFGIG
jgi:hypothetical protein